MKKIGRNGIVLCFALSLVFLISCTNQTGNEEETEVPAENIVEENEEKTSEEAVSEEEQAEREEEIVDGEAKETDTEAAEPEEEEEQEVVLENDAFKIFQPAPDTEVTGNFVVSGLARVFEGTIMYEFEDGHFILDKGVVTVSEGAPEWGEFEITIQLDEERGYAARVILSAENAKDGSRISELQIPVQVVEE